MSNLHSRPHPFRIPVPNRSAKFRAMTLVEVMVAMTILGMFLLGFLNTALQSRRNAESSVMQAAATSLVYGMVEQMKMLSYDTDVPTITDVAAEIGYDAFPATPAKTAPYIYIRLNQDQVTLLKCVNNTDPTPTAFSAPTTTPTTTAVLDPTKENKIGPINLSTATGTKSQPLKLSVWVWVDNISDTIGVQHDIADAKCVTIVYAYTFTTGNGPRTVINREVFVRTPFSPLKK